MDHIYIVTHFVHHHYLLNICLQDNSGLYAWIPTKGFIQEVLFLCFQVLFDQKLKHKNQMLIILENPPGNTLHSPLNRLFLVILLSPPPFPHIGCEGVGETRPGGEGYEGKCRWVGGWGKEIIFKESEEVVDWCGGSILW